MSHPKPVVSFLLNLWPVYKLGLWLGRQPAVGALLKPAFSSRIHQVTMLPVNEPIAQGQQTVLPYTLLQQLAQQASARFIMDECVCRSREHCASHPVNLGCLFLGDGAARIHPSLGRLCSAEEAAQHIQRGMHAGLYPLIAHTIIDAFTLGIPYGRMLTVCFCCECCCLVQRGLRSGPRSLRKAIQPLPGISFSVGENCTACGVCLPTCPVSAISMNHRKAEISEECKGCGICLNACPSEVILMELDEKIDLGDAFTRRISAYADTTSRRKPTS